MVKERMVKERGKMGRSNGRQEMSEEGVFFCEFGSEKMEEMWETRR